MDSFSTTQLATIAAAYLIAALVKGVTGLGYSSTCLPILTLAFGLKEALPLVLIPSVGSNLVVLATTPQFRSTAARFWPMYASAAVAVFAGLWTLRQVHGDTAAAALGVVLLAYVVFAMAKTNFRLDPVRSRPFEPLIGAATGMVNGLTGSQVFPVVPYLLALDLQRARFTQASNQCFTVSSAAMLVGLGATGWFTTRAAVVSVGGLVIVALGVRLGQRIGRALAPESFRRAVLVVLGALACGLVLKAFV